LSGSLLDLFRFYPAPLKYLTHKVVHSPGIGILEGVRSLGAALDDSGGRPVPRRRAK
jgi:hypothetical protein